MSPHQRRQVTDSFGWTHVTKGRKNQRNLQFLLPTELKPTKVTKGLCIQQVDEKCKRYTRKWKESDCYTKLNHFLHQVVLASDGLIITNCVCLGLGSLTGTHSGVGENVDSWYQLVTLVSILETLRKGHQIEQVYVQDPTFNCLDQQFLESLGYTVLPTPNALEAMTPTTFLFDPHLEWKHSASALEKAHPSFRIGNSLTTFSVWNQFTEREKEIYQAYLDSHSTACMPEFDLSYWCKHTALYWIPACPDSLSHPLDIHIPHEKPKNYGRNLSPASPG